MSRPTALLLLSIAVPSVLCGVACGGNTPEPQTPAPTSAATATPSSVASAPTGTSTPASTSPAKADTSLPPRRAFAGNPDVANVQVSPDGKWLSWLAAVDGVLNVHVAPAEKPGESRPVTKAKERPIRIYQWAYDGKSLVYQQDAKGDENWHVHAVDVKSGDDKDLTPYPGARAQGLTLSAKHPTELAVGLNDRDPRHHDMFRVDMKTGRRVLMVQNDEGYAGFTVDDDLEVRLAEKQTSDGGNELFKRVKGAFQSWTKVSLEDGMTTQPWSFDATGKTLYMADARDRDTAAVFAIDFATGKPSLLAEDARVDAGQPLFHPKTHKLQAVSFEYDRTTWKAIDPGIEPDLAYLKTVTGGDLFVTSRSLDDKRWTVAYTFDDGPVRYYRYDRDKKKAAFLFVARKALEGLPLSKMTAYPVKSRDGLTLLDYVTVPKAADPDGDGKPNAPLATVLFVHGGPWARDRWGYNPTHQWLASRGYAVVSVNFRGSTGFGKKFINAANGEWGKKMHDDLVDSVDWAVKAGIADKSRVAIMGGSYGGYSALAGLTFTPDTFACAVDIVGPSNLQTLLETIPPYWQTEVETFTKRIGGDHRTEAGRRFLTERSPLTYVKNIQRPLLIGQGANDPRVKQSESDQIVKAMQARQIPVTYVLFSDEGHGFARPQNRLAFDAVTEAFLAQHLGGSYQPIGEDFAGSTVAVPAGADGVVGVAEALTSKPKN